MADDCLGRVDGSGGAVRVFDLGAAACAEDRLACRRDALHLETRHRLGGGFDRVAGAAAQPLDEVPDVVQLLLGDVDQREVAHGAVRSVQHEEIREARHRDRHVGLRAVVPE
ncbi:MAG: hypothetical protein ACK55I_36915, partial [bacterium]